MKTKKENYLHLYLGCDVIVSDSMGEDVYGKLISISLDSVFVSPRGKKTAIDYAITDYVKLVLRPISNMTTDEHDEYIQLDKQRPNFGMQSYWYEREEWDIRLSAGKTNWLRKNGFDCDGLLKSGEAIDKTKL